MSDAPLVHPSAVIDRRARLAAGVRVGPFVVIEGDVEVNAGAVLHPGTVLHAGTRIGSGATLGPYAVIGGAPMDKRYGGEPTGVDIGPGAELREHVTVHRATGEGERTRIGARTLLMTGVHVSHNGTVGDDAILTNLVQLGGHVEVGGYAGWLVVQPHRNGSGRRRFNVHYHHGYGGGAKRSKGILGADIDQKDFPDADFILRGHDHQKWHLPVTIDRISQTYRVEQRTVHHLRLGSYKKLGDRYAGWATEKNFATPRLGGWWARVQERQDEYVWEVREAT